MKKVNFKLLKEGFDTFLTKEENEYSFDSEELDARADKFVEQVKGKTFPVNFEAWALHYDDPHNATKAAQIRKLGQAFQGKSFPIVGVSMIGVPKFLIELPLRGDEKKMYVTDIRKSMPEAYELFSKITNIQITG